MNVTLVSKKTDLMRKRGTVKFVNVSLNLNICVYCTNKKTSLVKQKLFTNGILLCKNRGVS